MALAISLLYTWCLVLLILVDNGDLFLREGIKKKRFLWETFPKSVYPPTHPRVFVRFGKTKGEIWVEKGDFRGDLVFF